MVCLIFHAAILINRKNWRTTIKLHFENLSIFLKKSNVHTCSEPPPLHLFVFVRFSVTLPSPPQQTYFLIDPYKIYVVVPITETRIVREVKIRKLRLEKRF